MNDDDQLLQYYEEEYVIKTESYSTVVNSFQTPTSLSKNNQTKQAQLPSSVTISRPDGKLPNIVKAAVNSARSETATQTLLKPAITTKFIAPSIEKTFSHKDQSTSSDNLRFIFHKTKTDNKRHCERCEWRGLKVCEKNCPVLACNKDKKPAQKEIVKRNQGKVADQNTPTRNTCACSDDKNIQNHKSLIIMSSGRCNQCNKNASITSICIEGLFQQAKAYLEKLAEEHQSKCPRCEAPPRRPSCQRLNATGSNESVSCKEALFEQARVYLTQLTSEHKRTCDRCKKKEPCSAPKPQKSSDTDNIIQRAWSYIQNIGNRKRSCCMTKKECCPRCMKIGLPTCCKHSKDSNQAICIPCKPVLKTQEKKKIECPRCKKTKSKSVCLIDCPSDSSNKNLCHHCKQSLGLEPKGSKSSGKKDEMPVCYKHKDVSKCSSDTSCSSKSIISLLECLKKHANETSNKSCPKLCKKKSSEECISPVLLCKSAEDTGCSFDPCKASQSCCKKKVEKKPSCSASCSKSSESLEDLGNKPCIGPCTKKCPIKRSGCDFLEYHSSTLCSGPCQSNSMNRKMLGIKLSITPKPSTEEFCKHSCEAVKKVLCPYFDSVPKEPVSCMKPPQPPCKPPEPPCRPPEPPCRSPQSPCRSPQSPCRSPQSPCRSPQSPCRSPQSPCRSPQSPCRSPQPSCRSLLPPCVQPLPPCIKPLPPCIKPVPPCIQPQPPCLKPLPPCRRPEPPCARCSNESFKVPPHGPNSSCVKCNSQYSSTKISFMENNMVDAEYEAFLDDQFGRMVARELADKETVCDKNCDCTTCATKLKVRGAQSDDLNKYRFYY